MSSSSSPIRSYNRRRTHLDLDLNSIPSIENIRYDEGPFSGPYQQQQQQPQQLLILTINLNEIADEAKNNDRRYRARTISDFVENENERKSPEPPKVSPFNCPICLSPMEEAVSTRCGHIFCKPCIKSAIVAQGKCPTCRRNVIGRELRKVFLPAPTM